MLKNLPRIESKLEIKYSGKQFQRLFSSFSLGSIFIVNQFSCDSVFCFEDFLPLHIFLRICIIILLQNDPTRPMRQKNLELEQMRIYKCIRELDMSNGDMDPRSALTMITLSVLKEAGNGFDASSSVFCLQGIVCDVGPKLSHWELNKKPGWTISTHWITNPEMSQKMGQQWEDTLSKLSHDETREFAKGVLVFAKLNHMQQLEFKFPVFPRRGDATINDENSTMSFSSANSQLMCEIKAVHGGETNSRKFYRKVEEIKVS